VERVFAPGPYEIVPWPELIPDMVQFMVLDDVGNYLTLSILIVVVAFGILNTILMSVYERVREFGVLRAVGMRPRGLFALVMAESAMLAAFGILIGLAVALPVLRWLEAHPIHMEGEQWVDFAELFGIEPVIVFALRTSHLIGAPLLILLVALVAALPPALRASRGRPVDALREM